MADNLKTITVLFRAKNSFEALIKKDILSYGLNPSEFGALEALYHKGRLTVQQITEKVLIANSSMTYVLDNLVKRDLITRMKDETDRRIYVVDLTDKGRQFMDDIYPKHYHNMTSVLSCLTKEEERTLQLLLKKIGLGAKNCKCD
jgi:MarR family 2-MHQ and catechol resistance regulon transcriptional repressor